MSDAPDNGDATTPTPDTSAPRAQVNLLPHDVVRRRRQRRVAQMLLAAFVVYLGLLGGLYVLQLDDVDEARVERNQAELEVAAVQAEADELAEFGVLDDRLATLEQLLIAAMDAELSWARIFGELALAFSRDASLVDLQAVSTLSVVDEDADVAPPDPDTDPGAEPDAVPETGIPVAEITFGGYSVERYAPGVEDVLVNFEDVDGFFGTYLATATDEDRGETEVTTFEGSVAVDESAFTHRYDEGLPTEVLE